MVRKLCVLIIVLNVVLLPQIGLSGERTYTFDSDNEWEAISADWEIVDGEYVKTDADTGTAGIAVLSESEEVDTQDVEVIEVMAMDLGTGPWQNLCVVFGFNPDNALSYQAGPFVGGAQEWRFQTYNSDGLGGVATVVGAAGALGPNIWYRIRLEFDGDTVVMFGAEEGEGLEEKLSYDLPDGIPSGRVGLGGNGANAAYDNFTVSGAAIQGMAVTPAEKLGLTWAKLKTNRAF